MRNLFPFAGPSLIPLSMQEKALENGPQVYFASREDIYRVARLLRDIPIHAGGTYIGVIGGLGTLNYASTLSPRQIVLKHRLAQCKK